MILEFHGSIVNPDKTKLVHRRFLTRNKLITWASNQKPFVSVTEAFYGQGIAITIDDGTYAAYETALELRSLGHQVTVYINMFNVLEKTNYYFHIISALLDEFFVKNVTNKTDFSINEKEAYRKLKKSEFIKITNEIEWKIFLEDFTKSHSLEINYKLPKEIQAFGIEECKTLIDKGVILGNHCFDHFNPQVKDIDKFEKSVKENDSLIKAFFNIEDNICAIPFGKWIPPYLSNNALNQYIWLLADKSLKTGKISTNVYNRISIDDDRDLETMEL